MSKTKQVVVEVTAEDIALGQRANTRTCALARAIHRIPGLERAEVGGCSVRPSSNDFDGERDLSARAENFVRRFDEGEPVKPGRFLIRYGVAE